MSVNPCKCRPREQSMSRQAKSVMESGGLVSDDIVVGIIRDRITLADCCKACAHQKPLSRISYHLRIE
eukprot:1138450-Amphidinium_carterae.1